MRFGLNLKVVLCIFLFNSSSCQRHLSKLLEDGSPGLIIVSGIDDSGNLILKDVKGESATTFLVAKGKTIEWLVLTDKVLDIIKIHKKNGSKDLFSIHPNRIGNSSHQHGRIAKNAKHNDYEEYYIKWIDQAGNEHTYDPKIQVQ